MQINFSQKLRQRLVTTLLMAFVVIGLLTTAYLYYELQAARTAANPTQEAKNLAAKVGKIFRLPSTNTPTLATIDNLESVQSQTFFQYAKIGDKVLIFTDVKKAILYRPSTNKVIEVSTIAMNDTFPDGQEQANPPQQPQVAGATTPTKPPQAKTSIAIYNATGKEDSLDLARNNLPDQFPQLNPSTTTQLSETIPQSLVLAKDTTSTDLARDLARQLNANLIQSTDDLPATSRRSSESIILIIGENYLLDK